ncbi:major facilitator superfamily transporter [Aureobasidium subglaciale]|nr:major facilitator superfamily transporter [Aureobasidium subglaciale]
MSSNIHDDHIAPGTVRLIDANGELNVRHSEGHGDIVLVPTPSGLLAHFITDDPEDPLNWTKKRKLLQTACMVMYTVMMVFPSAAVYSVAKPISTSTGISITTINRGTGIMFLFYGWSTIVWQALALQYGKRPVYLVSAAASVVIMAVAPMCRTSGTYLAIRIIQGFFGGPVESLCEISMTDIWFAHERPLYIALYGVSLGASGKLAPVFSAFINSGMGWEWTLWWCAIGIGIAFFFCFLFMEETNYDRVSTHSTSPSSQASLEAVDDSILSSEKTAAKDGVTVSNPASLDDKKGLEAQHPIDIAAAEVGQVAYPRKTYWQKLGVIDKKRPNRMLDIMWAPFKFFTFPVVVWAGLQYGLQGLVWPGVLNATASVTYTNSFYHFSSDAVGFAYFAAVVGMILGSLWVTLAGPWLVIKLARRRGGVSEPEDILWLFTASFVVVPFALILWGVGSQAHIHWFGLVFAQAILAIASTLCLSTAIQYATSAYRDLSGELITTIILIRNTLRYVPILDTVLDTCRHGADRGSSFAINYGINPWIEGMGTRNTFIMAAVIAFVLNGTMFLMIPYGRRLREHSARRYWTYVEQARAKGLGH